jgi:hypothetical protein
MRSLWWVMQDDFSAERYNHRRQAKDRLLLGRKGFVGSGPVFADGQTVDLRLTRSAAGTFSVSVNGAVTLSFVDATLLTTFSGPDSIIYFFMDDLVSLANYPNTRVEPTL